MHVDHENDVLRTNGIQRLAMSTPQRLLTNIRVEKEIVILIRFNNHKKSISFWIKRYKNNNSELQVTQKRLFSNFISKKKYLSLLTL